MWSRKPADIRVVQIVGRHKMVPRKSHIGDDPTLHRLRHKCDIVVNLGMVNGRQTIHHESSLHFLSHDLPPPTLSSNRGLATSTANRHHQHRAPPSQKPHHHGRSPLPDATHRLHASATQIRAPDRRLQEGYNAHKLCRRKAFAW